MSDATIWLRRAIDVAHALLQRAADPEDLSPFVAERGRCIAEAIAAARAAGGLDATERSLLADLRAQERWLVQALWLPRADAFRWLARRSSTPTARFPELCRLAQRDCEGPQPTWARS